MNKGIIVLVVLLEILMICTILWAGDEDISKMYGLNTGLGANDLSNMAWDGASLWVEGSGSLTNLVGEGHSLNDWISYEDMDGFGRGSISALWASGNTLLTAWGDTHMYQGRLTPIGDGISISFDHGSTWSHITVLDLFPERAEHTYPGNYTTIWDIKVINDVIWCSITNGFLFKSENFGLSWIQVIPKELEPKDDYERYREQNYHGQCVDAYGDTLWVGTFQGMNLSTDKGETWTNFSWPLDGSGDPEVDPWPGNFPTAVEHKVVGGKTHVWVASQPFNYGRFGICHTSDNGATWEYKKYLDNSSKPYNIAFGHSGASNPAVSDSTVFVATTAGLLVSYDLGENWETMDIRESDTIYWGINSKISSVLVVGDTLFVTSSDGLARSTDWGETWEIFKGLNRVKTIDTDNRNIGISATYDYMNDNIKTYAFPNPFSPERSNLDYSKVKLHYAIENDAVITVKIYNYSGKLLKELVKGEFRSGGRDYQEVWNGKDANNSIVPNGVYFYTIKTNKGDSARGKIMVLD